MEKINDTIHIVMTPVRNEAWVLKLFLTVTSSWADYIVIADQMSTDGSREIAASFPKVTLIDNTNPEFNEAERQAMLIDKAREIAAGRDCILWGLDADEIFDAHFQSTNDWRKIENSKPGDVFWFRWAEICPNRKEYWLSHTMYYPWAFHDDGKEPHKNYVGNMHSARIPFPVPIIHNHVDDFKVLHFAYVNPARVRSKRRFYTFIDWNMNHRPSVSLSRSYAQTKKEDEVLTLPDEFLYSQLGQHADMWSLVDCTSTKCWMDDYVYSRLSKCDMRQLRKLDIWNQEFLSQYQLRDPRTIFDKLMHVYLHKTHRIKTSLFIRAIDKILKKIY